MFEAIDKGIDITLRLEMLLIYERKSGRIKSAYFLECLIISYQIWHVSKEFNENKNAKSVLFGYSPYLRT